MQTKREGRDIILIIKILRYDVISMKWFHIEPCLIQNKDYTRTCKHFQTMTISKSARWNKISRIHSDNSFIHIFSSHVSVCMGSVNMYVWRRCPFYEVYIAHIGIGTKMNRADSVLIQDEQQLWNSEVLNKDNEHARNIYFIKTANCLHLQQRWT